MLFLDLLNCRYHFSLWDNTIYHTLVNVIISMTATAILIAIGFKFFSWYKTNYKNYLMLLFGLLAVGMIISLVGDNINELLLTKTISEKSPHGSVFLILEFGYKNAITKVQISTSFTSNVTTIMNNPDLYDDR